jgi:hypothetical protein
MEQDPYIFNKNAKEQVISEIASRIEEFFPCYGTEKIYQISKNVCRKEVLESVISGLFDIYFKSINYKDPEIKEPPP